MSIEYSNVINHLYMHQSVLTTATYSDQFSTSVSLRGKRLLMKLQAQLAQHSILTIKPDMNIHVTLLQS